MAEFELLGLDDERWSSFVASMPHASTYHHPAWAKLVSDTYGFRGFAAALGDGAGGLGAGAPMLEVGLPGRRRWISLPFSDSCPPLIRGGSQAELAEALARALEERKLRQIELRGELVAEGVSGTPVGVTHELSLERDPEAVFRRLHKSQVQRGIRRAERSGVTVRRAGRIGDLVDVFYELHVRTRKRLGTPVQPRRFFHRLWELIVEPGLGYVLVAEADGVPAAAGVFLDWKDVAILKYGASDDRFWPLRPNHALYWEAISTSCEAGKKVFDFGRCELGDTGLRQFKRQWGAEERTLAYTTIGGGPPSVSHGALAKAAGGVIRRSPAWVCVLLGRALYKYAA